MEGETGLGFLYPVNKHGTGTGQGPKAFFAGLAERAGPVLRQVVESCAGWGVRFRLAFIGVIDISAIGDLALIHVFGQGHNAHLRKKLKGSPKPPVHGCCIQVAVLHRKRITFWGLIPMPFLIFLAQPSLNTAGRVAGKHGPV